MPGFRGPRNWRYKCGASFLSAFLLLRTDFGPAFRLAAFFLPATARRVISFCPYLRTPATAHTARGSSAEPFAVTARTHFSNAEGFSRKCRITARASFTLSNRESRSMLIVHSPPSTGMMETPWYRIVFRRSTLAAGADACRRPAPPRTILPWNVVLRPQLRGSNSEFCRARAIRDLRLLQLTLKRPPARSPRLRRLHRAPDPRNATPGG